MKATFIIFWYFKKSSSALFCMCANYKIISQSTAYTTEPSIWLYCQNKQLKFYTAMCIQFMEGIILPLNIFTQMQVPFWYIITSPT